MAKAKAETKRPTDKIKYTVTTDSWLNVRMKPSLKSRVIRELQDGDEVTVDNSVETPEGWKALRGGGFVMAEYLR